MIIFMFIFSFEFILGLYTLVSGLNMLSNGEGFCIAPSMCLRIVGFCGILGKCPMLVMFAGRSVRITI